MKIWKLIEITMLGGKGSGHRGHKGIPGQRGGSLPGKGGGVAAEGTKKGGGPSGGSTASIETGSGGVFKGTLATDASTYARIDSMYKWTENDKIAGAPTELKLYMDGLAKRTGEGWRVDRIYRTESGYLKASTTSEGGKRNTLLYRNKHWGRA